VSGYRIELFAEQDAVGEQDVITTARSSRGRTAGATSRSRLH